MISIDAMYTDNEKDIVFAHSTAKTVAKDGHTCPIDKNKKLRDLDKAIEEIKEEIKEEYPNQFKTLNDIPKMANMKYDPVIAHKALTVYLNDLYHKKNNAYGDSFHETYQKMGIISAITRISDKYNRAVNLATHPDADPNDESLRDTLLDMANYCLMTVMELDRK